MAMRLTTILCPLTLASLAVLAGCGGGSAPTGDSLATGVLSDSPVAGVQYLRNGAASGNTDILGQFRYKAGETVEFRIGKLVLGSVTATGSAMTVTPLQLAQGLSTATLRANRVTNLLVLLQSLDDDGNPADGISIPAAAVAALDEDAEVATLDMDADPAVFLADPDLNAIVTAINAVDPAPLAAKPATVTAALDHFEAQFLSRLAGSWLGSIGGNPVALRFRDDGSYLMGEVGAADSSVDKAGLELGSIDWDPATGYVTVSAPTDTNGSWGLSYISALGHPTQLTIDGAELVVTERNASTGAALSSFRIPRHYDSSSAFTGTWAKGDSHSLAVLHLFMRGDGLVMAVNPAADKTLLGRTTTGCAQPGVEFGNYSFVGSSLFFSNISTFDTDGCGGLHDGNLDTDYLLATNAHVSPLITSLNYASTMNWSWNTVAGTQSAPLYRPNNAVPAP